MFPTKQFAASLLFLTIFIFQGYSQLFTQTEQGQLDSLNSILDDPTSEDTAIVSSYLTLSEILYVSNIDTLKYLCETTIELGGRALKNKNTDLEVRSLKNSIAGALNNLAYWYQHVAGNNELALEYYQSSLVQYEELNNKSGIAYAYENIASIYSYQAKIESALEYHIKALKIREETADKQGIASSLNSIAYCHKTQGNIDDARVFYTRSLELFEELEDRYGMANVYNNLAFMDYNHGNYDEAMKMHSLSLDLRKEIGDQAGEAQCYNNIGLVYYKLGESQKELEYYLKAFEIQKEVNNLRGLSYSYSNLGYVYLDLGEFDKAESSAKESLRIAKEIGYPENILKASSLLSTIYEKSNRDKEAFAMYKQYISMRDSIKNADTQLATLKLQAKYEFEKQKVLDDAAYDKAIALETEKKQKQVVITAATAGGLGLTLLFLIIVANRLKITRRQKSIIEKQRDEVKGQKAIIESAHKEITDSIVYAKRIQGAILPPPKIVKEYLDDSFVYYRPKDVVAGDFYWMRQANGLVLFAVADCTGHGVPGAMVSVVCNNALNRSVREDGLLEPGEILDRTRQIVIREFEKSEEDVKDGMDIALCSLDGLKLKYAGAHIPLWIIRNGKCLQTKANRQPIGIYRNPVQFETQEIQLEKGDTIYIFSDGFVDQFGGKDGKKYKLQQFKHLLISLAGTAMEAQSTILNKAFNEWKGNEEQVDDVCIIGVKV